MNDLETAIREQQKRLKRYDNIDGTGEMFLGCMFLGFQLSTLLTSRLPPHSVWAQLPAMLLPVYLVLGLAWWGVKIIKRRITYCRTGYVLPRRDKKAVALGLVYGLVFGAAVPTLIFLLHRFGVRPQAISLHRLLMLGTSVATYVFFARMTTPEHKWKMWFAALMALVAVPSSFFGWTMEVLSPLTLPLFGVIWFASGLITLRLFVRHSQPVAQADE